MTSFGSQFDFNDVTYHIGHCNVDTRRCNVVFTTLYDQNVSKLMLDSYRLIHIFIPAFFRKVYINFVSKSVHRRSVTFLVNVSSPKPLEVAI